MKITWSPSPGSPLILGDDTPAAGATGQKFILSTTPDFSQAVQAIPRPRQVAQEILGRANLATNYSFVVFYQFSSAGDCMRFLALLGKSMGSQGKLILDFGTDGGGSCFMNGAWQSARALEQYGKSTTVAFTFAGDYFR